MTSSRIARLRSQTWVVREDSLIEERGKRSPVTLFRITALGIQIWVVWENSAVEKEEKGKRWTVASSRIATLRTFICDVRKDYICWLRGDMEKRREITFVRIAALRVGEDGAVEGRGEP